MCYFFASSHCLQWWSTISCKLCNKIDTMYLKCFLEKKTFLEKTILLWKDYPLRIGLLRRVLTYLVAVGVMLRIWPYFISPQWFWYEKSTTNLIDENIQVPFLNVIGTKTYCKMASQVNCHWSHPLAIFPGIPLLNGLWNQPDFS